jgi:hypothetical protein
MKTLANAWWVALVIAIVWCLIKWYQGPQLSEEARHESVEENFARYIQQQHVTPASSECSVYVTDRAVCTYMPVGISDYSGYTVMGYRHAVVCSAVKDGLCWVP